MVEEEKKPFLGFSLFKWEEGRKKKMFKLQEIKVWKVWNFGMEY